MASVVQFVGENLRRLSEGYILKKEHIKLINYMKLNSNITLSQKYKKAFDCSPSFFTISLNEFYFLKDELGFRKPELSTWKNEANLIFASKVFEVVIAYESPNWIQVSFRKFNTPGRIYLGELLENLKIPFEKDLLKIQSVDNMAEIKAQMMSDFQKAHSLIKNNWDRISNYLIEAATL